MLALTKSPARRTKEKEQIEVDLSGEWPMVGRYDWEGLGPAVRGKPWYWQPGYYVTLDRWEALTSQQRKDLSAFMKSKGREIREMDGFGKDDKPGMIHLPIHSPVRIRGYEEMGHYITLHAPSCRNEDDISIFISNSDSLEHAEFRVQQFLEDLMKCGLEAA